MIKKVSILTLLLLFFISTTGLPLSIHFCQMENNNESQTCPTHNEMMKKIHQSCNQDQDKSSYFTSERGSCCKSGIADKPVTDNFLQADSQKHNPKLSFVVPAIFLNLFADYNLRAGLFNHFSDSSPPSLINNHIYLDNSILLI